MAYTTHLEHGHYAAKWPVSHDKEFNDLKIVNQAGIDYANLPDGQVKEEKLWEIVKYFHGYVFKYTDLVYAGHLPQMHYYNADTRKFLGYFLPKSEEPSEKAYSRVARLLRLAFPNQSATEVYDALTVLLLRCVKKYDPNYVVKVQDLVKIICKLPKKKKYFTVQEIAKKVKFDPIGAIRLLARKGYIKAVRGAGKKLLGYKITKHWPPSKEFLSSGPIGFVYVVQLWFRYYLQELIDDQTNTLEAKEYANFLQLEHRSADSDEVDFYEVMPTEEGDTVDPSGQTWATDTTLMKKSLDIPEMSPAWVKKTNSKFFSKMTERERHILYLYYVKDLPWKQIAALVELPVVQVQKIHGDTITFLKGKFGYTSQKQKKQGQ